MPDEGFTELVGDRVVLRRFDLGDVTPFVAYRTDAQVARFQSWDAPYSRDEGERFVRGMMRRHPDTAGEWFQFAVALRPAEPQRPAEPARPAEALRPAGPLHPAGALIGDCAAAPHVRDLRQCEIGFTIASGYQGQGYATEAARLLVGYLFTERGKHRITASCDARNTASAVVLKRLGMRQEGHLRESTWAKGEWTDDLLYGLLHHEWDPSRRSGQ